MLNTEGMVKALPNSGNYAVIEVSTKMYSLGGNVTQERGPGKGGLYKEFSRFYVVIIARNNNTI